MSELGDELRSTIEGAARPVTLDELATRNTARDRRGRRAPWRTFVAGVAVTALVIAGAVVVNLGDDEPSTTSIAAPTVVVGDIDLAVLSTSFDDDGARGPIDPSVVDTVRSVPGVAGAQGAMQRFVDVVRTDATAETQPPASERSAIAISWEEGAPLSFSAGGPPQTSGDIAINQVLASLYGVGVGDNLLMRTGSVQGAPPMVIQPDGSVQHFESPPLTGSTVHVTGVFTPASGDVDAVNLVVLGADDLGTVTSRPQYDRVDIVADTSVPIDELLDRVSAVLPSGTMVVPPSVIGFDAQLRAELEIQRAYHALLNPNLDERRGAIYGSPTDPESLAQAQRNWDESGSQTLNTELRVSRVTFVDAASAIVTYRAYYGGNPSPVVPRPLTGAAERVDGQWRLSQAGICELAHAANLQCASGDAPSTSSFAIPPDGWNAADSVPGLADAFRVLADPGSTIGQRLAAVDRGEQLRDAIEAGAKADASRTNVSFVVSGARLLDATHAQVVYSLIADGVPHLETPYPLVGNAVLVDGTWKVASRFACGLNALATLSCPAAAALPTTTTTPTTTSSTGPPGTTVTTSAPSTTDPNPVPTTLVTPTSTAP
jgi:hypothetical protein